MKQRELRELKREEAEIRQAERLERTDEEQLQRLLTRGHSGCDEADMLLTRMQRAEKQRQDDDGT